MRFHAIKTALTPTLMIFIIGSAVHFHVRRHARARTDARMAAAQAALEVSVPELRFENVRLADALQRISSVSGLTIRVDWESLARESITPDTPVRFVATNLRLGWTLHQVLVAAAPRAETFWPGFEVRADGTMRVASTHDLLRGADTRRYDIRDLAIMPRNSRGEVYGLTLREVIAEGVASRTWCPQPDVFGAVRYDGGWLVVTHTPAGHRAIERSLEQFRGGAGSQSARILNAEFTTPWE